MHYSTRRNLDLYVSIDSRFFSRFAERSHHLLAAVSLDVGRNTLQSKIARIRNVSSVDDVISQLYVRSDDVGIFCLKE